MLIANIIGARPQFIKYAPLLKITQKLGINEFLVHTGQHYDYEMSEVFFRELGIKEPEYHLEVGSGSQAWQTARVLERVESVLLERRSNVVIVYGDTNSTLGGALAAAKLHIPVAHVEAGLRSFNKLMPEEINRIAADHVSTLLFCPSGEAVKNLAREGFGNSLNGGNLISKTFNDAGGIKADCDNPLVLNTGDIMYDVLLFALAIAKQKSSILSKLNLTPKNYLLMTLHRAENTDDTIKLNERLMLVNEAANGRTVIFPMHPRTKKMIETAGVKIPQIIRVIEPLGYFDLLIAMQNASMVLTDSGGMQKEAFWLRVPCITLREETEWIETIESGWNVLARNYNGSHSLSDKNENVFGDGEAAGRIINSLLHFIA